MHGTQAPARGRVGASIKPFLHSASKGSWSRPAYPWSKGHFFLPTKLLYFGQALDIYLEKTQFIPRVWVTQVTSPKGMVSWMLVTESVRKALLLRFSDKGMRHANLMTSLELMSRNRTVPYTWPSVLQKHAHLYSHQWHGRQIFFFPPCTVKPQRHVYQT